MECLPIKRKAGQKPVCTCVDLPLFKGVSGYVEIIFNGVVIAESVDAKQLLEIRQPPLFYIPRDDVKLEYLTPSTSTAVCRWKGQAQFIRIEVAGRKMEDAAWYYPEPKALYFELRNHIAFYTHLMDVCYIDWKRLDLQPDLFYKEWVAGMKTGLFTEACLTIIAQEKSLLC
jgi:uncharacterized protein (DUF427 family)